jgi:pSer/pThr/pTyr-binding forkhead associated (FHA) protein
VSARLIGRTGATAGQDFVLMDVATIGASPDSAIRIVAPGVSRRHARIVADKDQYFLEDTGATNGTFLNGGRVQREALRHLDVITLGRAVDLIFIKRDNEPPVVVADQITNARVQIADGPEAGTVVDVPKGELTFGRAPSCNVVLTSGLISKVHARLQRTANQLVLQDLQSINGTFVNSARVDAVVVLKNGDVINFAGVRRVSVTIEGAAAAAAATTGVPAAFAELPAFNQEWKTRFVWAPDELALIEAARAEAMQLAAVRAPAAAAAADKKAPVAAKPQPRVPPKPPEAAKADVAPKPVVPAQTAKPDAAPKPAAAAIPPPLVAPKAPQPAKADEPAPTMAIGPGGDVISAAEKTLPMGAMKAPRIRGIKLVGPGTPIALGLGSFIVGRAIGSDVLLDDRQVSRSHARITVDETSAMIEDLQTVNGTLVNGKEVKARQPLHPGDTVLFGASEFKVELTTT